MEVVNNIVLDVTNKKGITAVVLAYKGKVVELEVFNSKYENQYENLIEGYIKGSKLLHRLLTKETVYSNSKLLIVSSNSALVSWISRNYSLPQYVEMFKVLVESLESIPLQYECIRSNDLISSKFATKSMIKNKPLQGVESLD